MTSQLVIFRAFLFIFSAPPPPTLNLKKKNSRKSTHKKIWPKIDCMFEDIAGFLVTRSWKLEAEIVSLWCITVWQCYSDNNSDKLSQNIERLFKTNMNLFRITQVFDALNYITNRAWFFLYCAVEKKRNFESV